MPSHFKVHDTLKPEELEQLEAMARSPATTVDDCWDWVTGPERSYKISRGAVGNWLREFREQMLRERISRSGELARVIKSAVAGGDFGDVADAAAMQLTQVVFEQSSRLEADGEIDPLDVQRMTRSLRNLVGTKKELVAFLAAKFDKELGDKAAKKGTITADDIAEARKAIFGL